MNAAAIIGLIEALGSAVTQGLTLVHQVHATLNEDDKAKVDAALAALQQKSEADYTRARDALTRAASQA